MRQKETATLSNWKQPERKPFKHQDKVDAIKINYQQTEYTEFGAPFRCRVSAGSWEWGISYSDFRVENTLAPTTATAGARARAFVRSG